MTPAPSPTALETERLLLRRAEVGDAAVYRQLWTERDERVPPHRRIGADDRPTAADIAAQIRDEADGSGPALLTVVRADTGEVIGYCGVVFAGHGAADEPELAFELLRAVHGRGYATEAGEAVLAWAAEAGYPRVWATVWDWNVASRRVLEKLGFRDTGPDGRASVHGTSLLTVRELTR